MKETIASDKRTTRAVRSSLRGDERFPKSIQARYGSWKPVGGVVIKRSLGQYSSAGCSGDSCGNVETTIDKKALHEWLHLGVRGEFGAF